MLLKAAAVLVLMTCLVGAQDLLNIFVEESTAERDVYKGFPMWIVCADAEAPVGIGNMDSFDPDAIMEYDSTENNFPGEDDDVQCIIEKNGELVYNENITWMDSYSSGIFEDADESWGEANITVTANWNGNQISHGFKTILNIPTFDCSSTEQGHSEVPETKKVGEEFELSCFGYNMLISKEQFDSLTVVWWRGCSRIERGDSNYKYKTVSYKPDFEGVQFDSLQILSASLERTPPGLYYCTLERNTAPDEIIGISINSHKICLQEPYLYANNPSITTSREEYIVKPGGNLTMSAFGNTGSEPSSLSISVNWKKLDPELGQWKDVCSEKSCALALYKNPSHCEALAEGKTRNAEFNDNYTATWTLSGVTENDAGLYQVTLITTGKWQSKNFTLKVEHPPSTPEALVVALILVGVLVAIALIVLVLLYVYSTEIRYLKKKIFGTPISTISPMAYLLYYPDASGEGNPVRAVQSFIGGRRFYDDNNPNGAPDQNQAGRLVGDHSVDMLQQCMSLVIFVTPDMLNENEIEIFTAYQGFTRNVQNGLPIVFIVTREGKKSLKRPDVNPVRTAFRDFMRIRKNKVIEWDPNHPNRFRRALYAFLPNVRITGMRNQDTVV